MISNMKAEGNEMNKGTWRKHRHWESCSMSLKEFRSTDHVTAVSDSEHERPLHGHITMMNKC